MIVGEINLTVNYAVVATSKHPISDCLIARGLFWGKECSLPDFMIVRNLNLNKSEHQISGCMLIRNSVQHGTEPAFSDSHSARYLPLSHKDPPKTSRQLSSVQFVWHHCDSWGAWCVRNWIGICYFAPVLDTYNWKLVPYTLTQLTLHFATRQDRESSLFTGRCIVANQDHSELWPRPQWPSGSVRWCHPTKLSS